MTASSATVVPVNTAAVSPIGSHVPVARGLIRGGVTEAAAIGAEVLQVFTGSPRGWAPPRVDPASAELFGEECQTRGWPVYVHAAYLINLASPDPVTLARSVDTLTATVHAAALLGASGVVVHTGSCVDGDRDAGLRRSAAAVRAVLDAAPQVPLLMEPTSGAANAMAWDLASTAEFLLALGAGELGLCLDTCHLHAAGEDLADPAAFARALDDLESAIGPGRVGLVHLNDSKDPRGSRRDRHESLGLGLLGEDGLRTVVSSPVLAGIPMIVETPTNARDVAYAKRLARPEPEEPR